MGTIAKKKGPCGWFPCKESYMTVSHVFLPMKNLVRKPEKAFKLVLNRDFPYKVAYLKALSGNE